MTDGRKRIKMVGLDLDGTLLTSEKAVTDYTRDVIRRAIEAGCIVLAATGRPLRAIPEEILKFPGMRYAVTANGARIFDLQTMEAIHENLLPVETAKQALAIFREYDAVREVFLDGKGYADAAGMARLGRYFDNPAMIRYMRETRTAAADVEAVLCAYNRPADKVHAIFFDPADRKRAAERILGLGGVAVTSSHAKDLDVNREGTDKGLGLIRLGAYLGIRREEIMACGDGENDAAMLKAAGLGVAMGNAPAQLKEAADYVTDTNDRDGVAKAIERFVLFQEGEHV